MTPFVWLSTKSHPKSTQNKAINAFHPDKIRAKRIFTTRTPRKRMKCTKKCRFPFSKKERTKVVTKREVLNGKLYAGNPHVRSDEGENASAATSRRGSLLYTMKATRLALCAAALGAFSASRRER